MGCSQRLPLPPSPFTPKPFKISNIYSVDALPRSIQRVVVLPLNSRVEIAPEALDVLFVAFYAELLKQLRFECLPIEKKELHALFGKIDFFSNEVLPDNFFSLIRKNTQGDAVLFVEITHYQPYKPVALGVRCQLIDAETKNSLWVLDELFDSGIPSVQEGLKRYREHHEQIDSFFDFTDSLLYTPIRFAHYVAFEIFCRLPRHFS